MPLVMLSTGLATALAVYALLALIFAEDRRVAARLERLSQFEREELRDMEPLTQPFGQRVIAPALQRLARRVTALLPSTQRHTLGQLLDRAGLVDVDPESYLAVTLLAGLACGVLGAVMGGGARTPRGVLVGALSGVIIGAAVPVVYLRARVSRRQRAIRVALPDMLDMLTISVEAGLGFDAAVAKLVASSRGPLAEEFSRMLAEIQAGISRQDAFRNLAGRTGVPELSTFATSMVQADVFGISVKRVLSTQAREMRVKRRQAAEEAAQKAPVKLVFPLVLCILPATIIVILGPAMVAIGRAFGLID